MGGLSTPIFAEVAVASSAMNGSELGLMSRFQLRAVHAEGASAKDGIDGRRSPPIRLGGGAHAPLTTIQRCM